MLKYGMCPRLIQLLCEIYNNIVNHDLIIDNFNISLITPIAKSKMSSSRPQDFRPISVSSVFCTIYERLILEKN